jgi:WD40 repeat protein/serine/threonine protein kinase
MPESVGDRDPLEVLAEQFLDRYRNGERPAISEFTSRHPELAEAINDLFPTLVVMEELRPGEQHAAPDQQLLEKRPPDQLGEYHLLREVGRGGMGVVYEAVQQTLGRRVALKVLTFDPLADPKRLERFHREAQAVAKLHHTNIVPVFGVGEQGGTHFFAMQFIDGCSLDSVIHTATQRRSGATTVANQAESTLVSAPTPDDFFRRVAKIGVHVAEALAYAHLHGILHRDIKPSNLLLDAEGTVWVTDFGLAKADSDVALTESGDIVGTLRYMAPERFRGVCDARCDIYSLGATLYESLALRPLFDESDKPRLIDCIQHEEPPPLRKLDARIPRDLETVIRKALAKDPVLRYATANELAEDLRRFLLDRPVLARRIRWWQRAWRWCRRNKAVALLMLSLFVALVTGTVASAILAGRADENARQANKNAAEANRERDQAESLLYDTRAILALRDYRANELFSTRQLLEAMKPLPERPDLRHFEWYYLNRLANPDNRLVDTCNAFATVAMTPDARYIAYVLDNTQVNVQERTGQLTTRIAAELLVSNVQAVALTPDGRYLALAGGNERYAERNRGTGFLRVWDLVEKKWLPAVERKQPRDFDRVLFSPDSRYLAVASPYIASPARGLPNGTLQVLEMSTGRMVFEKPSPTAFAFTADSRELAVSESGALRYWDLGSSGARTRFYALPAHGVTKAMAFSPSGEQLATVRSDGTVRLFYTRTGMEMALFKHHGTDVGGVVFLASGKVASVGDDGRIEIWNLSAPSDSLTLRGHTRGVASLAASLDGKLLLSVGYDHEIRLWDVTGDPEARSVATDGESPWGVSFDGTGKWLTAVTGKQILLCKAAGGGVVRSWNGSWSVVPSHDGRFLAGCNSSGAISLWRTDDGEEIAQFPLDAAAWQALQNELKELRPSWAPQGLATILRNRVRLALTNNDGLLAAQLPGQIMVCDIATRKERLRIALPHAAVPGSMALSADGKRLAWAENQIIKVQDLQTQKAICELTGHAGSVITLCFQSDGRTLLSGSDDATIKMWDVDEGKEKLTLRGHTGRVSTLALSADDRRLASGSYLETHGTVKIWDLCTGQETFSFERPISQINSLAFSPDGRQLAIAGSRLLVLDGTEGETQTRANVVDR